MTDTDTAVATGWTIDNIADFVGREIGLTDWFVVDQPRIDAFADVTEDRYALHVDPDWAATGPFGATVAHGFLSLSLLSQFAYEIGLPPPGTDWGVNYGFERVRFMAPVRVGKRIRARFRLAGVADKGEGRLILKHNATVEIEGEIKPALVATWLTMAVRPAAPG